MACQVSGHSWSAPCSDRSRICTILECPSIFKFSLKGAKWKAPQGLKPNALVPTRATLKETVSQLIFRPFGAWVCPTWLPTACTVGFILAPLCGWNANIIPLSSHRLSCDTVSESAALPRVSAVLGMAKVGSPRPERSSWVARFPRSSAKARGDLPWL